MTFASRSPRGQRSFLCWALLGVAACGGGQDASSDLVNGASDEGEGSSGFSGSSNTGSFVTSGPSGGALDGVTTGGTGSTTGTTGAGSTVSTTGASMGSGDSSEAARTTDGTSDSSDDSEVIDVQAGQLTAGVWDDNQNFERFLAYRKRSVETGLSGMMDFSADDHRAAQKAAEAARVARDVLDIALVIDTTGSMGDELSYLQAELNSISARVEDAYPNAEQRWALVFYRDYGDEYETRVFDFDGDVAAVRAALAEQKASGGGDTPEAAHAALQAAVELEWRTGPEVSRLAFWLADAPHHAAHAVAMTDAVKIAQELDVHLYPVAASGVDELSQLTMRSAAQLTLGRYLFLTDDSGIGNAHAEPDIPCYFVTRLDQAMLRMIDVELSGEYREPEAEEILRTGGDPQDGACELGSGEVLEVF